jgi:hypothetical protein
MYFVYELFWYVFIPSSQGKGKFLFVAPVWPFGAGIFF